MKYQLNGEPTAPQATAPAAKPYDFAAAAEALSENLEHTRASYSEYVAAEGRVLEVERVLEDLSSAVGSISKYGITVQNMALLNSDNCLDKALGLENLAIESLASLSAETMTKLQGQYVKSLEGKAGEMFKALVERVKAFFTKLINWLKDIFTGNGTLIKMVQEAKFDNLDPEKKITALNAADTEAAVDTMQKCLDNVKDTNKSATQLLAEAKGTSAPDLQKKSGTLAELGWTAEKAKAIQSKFLNAAKPTEMNNAWTAIQKQYREEIAQNGEDPAMRQKLADSFANWRAAAKVTASYSKVLRQVGFALMAVSKASKAAAPAAPAK